MEVNKEKIRYISQFFFDKGKNANTFDVKDAHRTGRPVVEDVSKFTEVVEVDRHVNSPSITQELKIDYKTVLNHLRKIAFKKKLNVWMPHHLTPKNIMDRISSCEALGKQNEIDPFFKRRVNGDEKGVTYDNIVRKGSWSQSAVKHFKRWPNRN
ncbi:histone-lysine N-methyltransferase SETMAR [Trichonephila clavipes]|nr:histone-lysine N-methyltransferase SETMAR [Trichonephila clavipes]